MDEIDGNKTSKFYKLKLFWNCFLQCENETSKQTYLELFMYEFYKSDENEMFREEKSFLSLVPSQLSCHILQMIYATICASISSTSDDMTDEFDTENNKTDTDTKFEESLNVGDGCYNDLYKRNLMKQSSDLRQVISLREFLLAGTGGRILEILQIIGVTNITCGRELTSLLINLFPTGSWNDEGASNENLISDDFSNVPELIEYMEVYCFYYIGDYRKRNSLHGSKSDANLLQNPNFLQSFDEFDILNDKSQMNISSMDMEQYKTVGFKKHIKRKMPCKQFSSILLNLLAGLVSDEKLAVIDQSSSTIQCLYFALDKLELLNKNKEIFSDEIDREKIRRKLLILILISLNKLYLLNGNIPVIFNVKHVLNQMFNILECDLKYPFEGIEKYIVNIKCDIIFGIYYSIFVIINNTYLKNLENDFKKCTNCFENHYDIFNLVYKKLCHGDESKFMFKKIMKVIMKIILNIKMFEETGMNYQRHRKMRKYKKEVSQKVIHHQEKFGNIKCTLENRLLNMLEVMPIEQNRVVICFFQQYGLCCCNCNLDTIRIVINIFENGKLQRNCLNFIKTCLLRTILDPSCSLCEDKQNLSDFETQFPQLYKNLLEQLTDNNKCVFLKHIGKIASNFLLKTKISENILLNIILPLFKTTKDKLILRESNQRNCNDEIVLLCLNSFANYLLDVRLIENFYTDENINYLEDLLKIPETVPFIFSLIKIGLLNKNEFKNKIFIERLINMPIKITIETTTDLLDLFTEIHEYDKTIYIKSKKNKVNKTKDSKSILITLRLSAVYWNMTLQLMQSNEQFKREFIRRFYEVHHDSTIIYLVYNSLSCTLNINQIKNSTESDEINNSLLISDYCLISKHDRLLNEIEFKDWFSYDLFKTNNYCDINTSLNNRKSIFAPKGILTTYNNDIKFFENVDEQMLEHIIKLNLETKTYNRLTYKQLFEDPVFCCNEKYYHYIFNINESARELKELIKNPVIYDCAEFYKTVTYTNTEIEEIFNKYTIEKNENNELIYGRNQSLIDSVLYTSIGKINKILNRKLPVIFSNKNEVCDKIELNIFKTAESKKLLIQIFEITFGVLVMDGQKKIFESKMSIALDELKTLIVNHSVEFWNSIENGTAILNALQSLLKAAKSKTKDYWNLSNSIHETDIFHNKTSNDLKNCETELLTPVLNIENEFFGSDMDNSEEHLPEENMNADDGYDADAENCNYTESGDLSLGPIRTSQVSNYRNTVTHSGISKIVIEILFILSKRCVIDPKFWPGLLYPFISRLTAIRENLGGSVFLIKGFRPVLEVKDDILTDLQKSILELITDLNTPEALSEYLGLLASSNPPVDLLLLRLSSIASTKVQSSAYVEFPFIGTNSLFSSCDPTLTKMIKMMYEYHTANDLKTAFTQSKLIVPLNYVNFIPWSSAGFTATTWIKIIDTSTEHSEETDVSIENFDLLHLLSVGNENLLLTIYLDYFEGCALRVHLSKPNAEIDKVSSPDLNEPNSSRTFDSYFSKKPKRKFKNIVPVLQDQINVPRSLEETNDEKPNVKNKEIKQHIFKTTTSKLRSSLSSFNIFSSLSSGKTDEGINITEQPIEIENIKIQNDKWTHLSFSVEPKEKSIEILMIIDGTEQEILQINCPIGYLNMKKINLPLLTIGDHNCLESDQKKKYCLSNVMLFREAISQIVVANLVGLGPDCTNFSMIENIIPNLSFLNNSKIYSTFDLKSFESLKILRDQLICVFSAHRPNILIGYSGDLESLHQGEIMGVVTFGDEIKSQQIPSFQTASILSGGIAPLMFLLARVVELSPSPFLQSMSLNLLLQTTHSNSDLYLEFLRSDGIGLIGSVLRTTSCVKGLYLLKCILDVACDGPVIVKKPGSETFQLITNTNACVVHSYLLISVITRYWDWYSTGKYESDVLDLLFSTLLALVREKHPHHAVNVYRLSKSGLVSSLLNFCKVYLVGASRTVYISKSAAKNLVNLIRVFAGAPPTSSLLDEIMKLLLIMHRPSDSFVTHDRSKFYFLLSSAVPNKQKRLSLPITTSRISQSLRIKERKSTISISKSPIFTKFQRSISLDLNVPERDPVNEPIINVEDVRTQPQDVPKRNKENQREFKSDFGKSDNSSVNGSRQALKLLDTKEDSKLNKIISNMQIREQRKNRRKMRKISRQKHKFISAKRSNNEEDEGTGDKSISESGLEEESPPIEHNNKPESVEDFSNLENKLLRYNTNRVGHLEDRFLVYNSEGFIQVQESLFNLLRDFILILPDSSVQEVLNHYVTVEILMVLSNHKDVNVRTAIIRLLAIMCGRLPASVITNHSKQNYWYHLGNQISLHQAEYNLVQACVQWTTGSCLGLDQILNLWNIEITQKYGINTLIAILPQTVHNNELTTQTFQLMEHLYEKVPSCSLYMIECGLILSSIKSLTKLLSKFNTTFESAVQSITSLLKTISFKSLISVGYINILWDVLNGLSFIEQTKTESVFKSVRIIQSKIFIHLLESCFNFSKNHTSLLNVKLRMTKITIPGCTLSSAEMKTRFDLLLDRMVQFITNTEQTYLPNEIEIKLLDIIIKLTINGHSRGSNVIQWALCPARSLELKLSVVKSLCNWKHGNINNLGCDLKMIKILVQSFFLTNREEIPETDLKIISEFNQSLGEPTNNSWNLPHALETMEKLRDTNLREQRPATERSIYKMEPIAQACIESAMKITRDVVELQNMERRLLMNHMRTDDDDKTTIIKWNLIIQNMTHDGAPWFSSKNYSNSWELDTTEGPGRIRTRLKRCYRNMDSKFLLSDVQEISDKNETELLNYLKISLKDKTNFCANEQVLYNFIVKYLRVDNDVEGEFIVTESQIVFVSNKEIKETVIYDISSITEIWPRRYQHEETGLEFFLETGNTMFIIMKNQIDRATLLFFFGDKVLQCPDNQKLTILIQQWKEGQLSNWEYLTILNQISGRTYQDLMQYPVFPWILSDYESLILDLCNEESFRNLEKPIAIQHEENELHYINNYNYLSQSLVTPSGIQMGPYHFGSLYSNSGTVLHFLVRLLPFTKLFLQYQDNNFDIPDRTFHSIQTTWRLASKDSPTDVKELIPEFYCLPEILENNEGFNFGIKQCGDHVNHVKLPPWCNNSARLFVLIHRQALESNIVSKNLNKWIDLIFGFKQTGSPAVDAINVFHPATYYGFSCSNIEDPVEKTACETMVKTYGQMPRQLMKTPHPSSNTLINIQERFVMPNVKGLRWGIYTGSPQLPDPVTCNVYQQIYIQFNKLVSLDQTNVIYGVPDKCNVMQGNEPDTMNMVSWGESDDIVRIKPLCEDSVSSRMLVNVSRVDPISACGTNTNSTQLWFGHQSGRISVYQCTNSSRHKYNKNRYFQHSNISKFSYNSAFRKVSEKLSARPTELDEKLDKNQNLNNMQWSEPVFLVRHTDEVTDIQIAVEFKIVVSVAKDGVAAIWDANKIQYIRSVPCPASVISPEIYLVAISPTLGDIVTIHNIQRSKEKKTDDDDDDKDDKDKDESFEVTESNIDDFVKISMNLNGTTLMRLHTINAKYVNHVLLQEKILSICFSSIKEGTGVNTIVAGLENGVIRFWSSWDLSFIREIIVGKSDVISLTFSTYQHLVVLTRDDIIQVWGTTGLQGNSPKLPQIVFSKRITIL